MKFIPKIKFIPFYVLSIVPMFVLHILSDIIFVILYYLIKYRRKVVFENLKNSFKDKSFQERKKIEKEFYQHFCDIIFETIKTITISKNEITSRLSIKNPEMIQKYFDQKRDIVLYSAHFGNWEWLSFLPHFVPYHVNSLYQPLSNNYFEEITQVSRSRNGLNCIPSKVGYKTIISYKRKNILTINIIAGDQRPRKSSSKHWVKFLNQDTAFLIGADRIAKKSNQVVIFPSFKKTKRGHYEIEFQIIEEEHEKENTNRIIDKYAELLENAIIKSPDLWLWSHKRWKLSKE
ncbi:MAG: hypothetical protein HN704_10980 [Bacteroidetes bacterium]|jgi:Kdo2-lipid IVA lauroyltransferase/acyltransferase|nr:hypothetical protein [Bacteroidota bacterium]MBT6687990.1 hypothetical protein [Bacteroidota bacterium]MBT7144945.1 hypothetical protein [Bacteroidota bacterium]MBT7492115.1 hypothetical protein [Bacteroidota bacterium]